MGAHVRRLFCGFLPTLIDKFITSSASSYDSIACAIARGTVAATHHATIGNPMKHTLGQAAKACDVSKSTLSRWIQKGRISAERQEDGSFLIDASELNRIKELQQQAVAGNGSGTPPMQQSETPYEVKVLQLKVDMMREQMDTLRQEREQDRRQHERILEDLRQDRDAWRTQAERQTLLLTHIQKEPAPKATFWQRVLGT